MFLLFGVFLDVSHFWFTDFKLFNRRGFPKTAVSLILIMVCAFVYQKVQHVGTAGTGGIGQQAIPVTNKSQI